MAPSESRHACNDDSSQEPSLDAWIDLTKCIRDKRNKLYGADLFGEPAWEIMLFLGGDARVGGAVFDEVLEAVGMSGEVIRRWLALLEERGHVEYLGRDRFRLSPSARRSLPRIIL